MTFALVSTTYAVQCYSGCTGGTYEQGGTKKKWPGDDCTDERVDSCDEGCATFSFSGNFAGLNELNELVTTFADAKVATCAGGDDICSGLQSSLTADVGPVKDFECKIFTCDTDKCNDPTKTMDGGEDGAESGDDTADSEEKERAYNSSLAVHISAALLPSVFGYLL